MGEALQQAMALPLFPSRTADDDRNPDRTLEIIERDLAIWDALRRRSEVDPRLRQERARVVALGRDLRALRDCYLTASHPRVRQALLREAGATTRRMKALGLRLRVRGLDVLPEMTRR